MNVVFGGTFNPITTAHEKITEVILNKFPVEHFIYLPVGSKYVRKKVDSVEHRVEMIKLAFKENPKVIVSMIEIENHQYEGTYASLKKLSEVFDDLYFLLGADNLFDLHTWINHDRLIQEFKFIVINRDEKNLEEFIKIHYNAYREKFTVLNFNFKVSSSMVRENLTENKDLLNPEVYQYIKRHKLYEVKSNV